jgi:hypothetical protein
MTMIKKAVIVAFALLLPAALTGQDNDIGIWYEVKAEKKIVKHLRFDLETSIRTDENASNIYKFFFEPGLRYKFNDYFAAGVYYRLAEQKEDDDSFHLRHRWFVQFKVSAPSFARFTLSLRYRIQEQFKTYIEDPGDEVGEWYQRARLELDYDVKGVPLKPYVNTEIHNLLFDPNDYTVDRWRTIIGVEYTLNKKHTFGVEYIYNESRVTKPPYKNLIGLTYSINL